MRWVLERRFRQLPSSTVSTMSMRCTAPFSWWSPSPPCQPGSESLNSGPLRLTLLSTWGTSTAETWESRRRGEGRGGGRRRGREEEGEGGGGGGGGGREGERRGEGRGKSGAYGDTVLTLGVVSLPRSRNMSGCIPIKDSSSMPFSLHMRSC